MSFVKAAARGAAELVSISTFVVTILLIAALFNGGV